MNVLLMVSWSRSGGTARRCTICCRCLGLEVVAQHKHVRFVAGVLVSKWCPITKIYNLLPVSWSRSGAPALRCTICCRCPGLEVVPQHKDVRFADGVLVSTWWPNTKMYDLLPVSWSVAGVLVSKWCPSPNMYDLLPVSWSRSDAPELRCIFFSVSLTRSGAPALRCTICCRCLGLEVVPQH